MSGATRASISVRIRFTVASSSALLDAWTSQKSLFGAGNGLGCFAGFSAKIAVAIVISVLLSFERRQLRSVSSSRPRHPISMPTTY